MGFSTTEEFTCMKPYVYAADSMIVLYIYLFMIWVLTFCNWHSVENMSYTHTILESGKYGCRVKRWDLNHTMRGTYVPRTGRSIKNPSEFGGVVKITWDDESQNDYMYYRCDDCHIFTKIDREIFWKYFWPLEFEIWIWKFNR